MRILVEGKMRHRTKVGRSFYQIVRWHETRFRHVFEHDAIEANSLVDLTDDLTFRCEPQGGLIYLHAEVRKKHFVVAELGTDEAKKLSFSILSVAGYEVSGKVSFKPV